MNVDFLLILTGLSIVSGLIWLVDALFWASKRKRLAWERNDETLVKRPMIVDYAKSFFPVFIVVLLIRSFIVQPFKVPTGSLEPTVQPVEFLLVNQFTYGLRLPVWGTKILSIGEPKRGDIMVFHWPVNPRIDFVKRVIGIPGDQVSYINGVFYINGKEMKQSFITDATDDNGLKSWPVKVMQEDLDGVKHKIYVCADQNNCPSHPVNFYNLVIPKGKYLMVGDNRNNSDDGRDWGLVPEKDIVGKAFLIVLSWDSKSSSVRWNRIGTII